jgi:triphosphoribosyl-dephospho-CoA synthase
VVRRSLRSARPFQELVKIDHEWARMKTDHAWTRNDSKAWPLERCLALVLRSFSEGGREAENGSPRDPYTQLAALARQALIAEAELTPKPGLVDRRGSGAHTDLSLTLMRRSACAIEPFIRQMALQSRHVLPSPLLRASLASTGRAAEQAMLCATNGANTHKGAIWTLGLLAAAAAGRGELLLVPGRDVAASVARTAGQIASFASLGDVVTPKAKRRTPNALLSHGQIVAKKFGVSGARGEAIQGFPHIITIGLPVLRARRRAKMPESIARLDALLSIMAHLNDTCLLYRGGRTALQAAQAGATAVLAAGGAGFAPGRERLLALDSHLLALGVSPGGSADLLAGTLFLDAIERHQTEIWTDVRRPEPMPNYPNAAPSLMLTDGFFAHDVSSTRGSVGATYL